MKSDKGQTMVLIGISLLVLSAVCVYISLSQPKISAGVIGNSSEITATLTQRAYATSVNADSNNGSAAYEDKNSTQSNNTNNDSKDEDIVCDYPLNINTATVEELCTIDGIGSSRASLIVAYRQHLGKYTSVEQIKDIKGFGDSLYNKVSPYLTV